MSDSNPASPGTPRTRYWNTQRGVVLLAGGALALAVMAIVGVAGFRAGSDQDPPRAAIGTQTLNTAPAAKATLPSAGPALSGETASQTAARAAAPRATEKPSFDVVHVGPDGGVVIAGRAAPDAEVTVRDGARELGQVKADARGEWVLLPDQPLDPGARELTLSARNPQNAASGDMVQGDASVLLAVPARKEAAAAQPTLAVLTPETGGPRLLQGPPAAGGAPEPGATRPGGHLGMDVIEYDQHGEIRFGGGAPAGAPVRVYVDNQPAGDARADAQGRWTLNPSSGQTSGSAVAPGMHRLRVDQLAANGRVVGRVELPFQRVELSAAEMGAGRIVVQPGQNLWRIARLTYGRGIHYTVIYRANLDQIRDPALIYPGQAFAVPSSPGPAPIAAGGPPPMPISSIRSR